MTDAVPGDGSAKTEPEIALGTVGEKNRAFPAGFAFLSLFTLNKEHGFI